MRPTLDGIIADQHGIFARWQAIGCGVTPREFDRLSRGAGPWIKVRYGVYALRERWHSLSGAERQVLRDRAALLVCGYDAVLSHSSAARILDIPLYDVPDQLSHVTRTTRSQTGRVQASIKHHMIALDPDDMMIVDGVRVTSPERTVADLSREYGFHAGIVAADAVLHAGADPGALTATVHRLTTEPGAPTIAAVVEAADGGAETPIETLGRLALIAMGITDLELQYVIPFSGGGRAIGDIYATSLHHLFECDGRLKYEDQFDRDGQLTTAEQVVWLEKKREDKIRSEGFGVSRLLWSDVQPRNFERTAKRLRQEIADQSRPRTKWLPPGA